MSPLRANKKVGTHRHPLLGLRPRFTGVEGARTGVDALRQRIADLPTIRWGPVFRPLARCLDLSGRTGVLSGSGQADGHNFASRHKNVLSLRVPMRLHCRTVPNPCQHRPATRCMKRATNALAGRSIISRGAADCSTRPFCITATRSPSFTASA